MSNFDMPAKHDRRYVKKNKTSKLGKHSTSIALCLWVLATFAILLFGLLRPELDFTIGIFIGILIFALCILFIYLIQQDITRGRLDGRDIEFLNFIAATFLAEEDAERLYEIVDKYTGTIKRGDDQWVNPLN